MQLRDLHAAVGLHAVHSVALPLVFRLDGQHVRRFLQIFHRIQHYILRIAGRNILRCHVAVRHRLPIQRDDCLAEAALLLADPLYRRAVEAERRLAALLVAGGVRVALVLPALVALRPYIVKLDVSAAGVDVDPLTDLRRSRSERIAVGFVCVAFCREILDLCFADVPLIILLTAGIPDVQHILLVVIDKGGTVNEVLIPLPAARRENGLGIGLPGHAVLGCAEQQIGRPGIPALRIGTEQTPVFVFALDPLHIQMPRDVVLCLTLQHERRFQRFRGAPGVAVIGAAKLDEAVLIVPSDIAAVLIGVIRPHQPFIRAFAHHGGRLHIVLIAALSERFLLIDREAAVVFAYLDPAQLRGRTTRVVPFPDVIDPELVADGIVDHVVVAVVRLCRLLLDLAQRVFNAGWHDPDDAVVGGGKARIFKLRIALLIWRDRHPVAVAAPCVQHIPIRALDLCKIEDVRVRDVIGCLARIFIGRDGQHIAVVVLRGLLSLVILRSHNLDLNVMSAMIAIDISVIPDADIAGVDRCAIGCLHGKPRLYGLPIFVPNIGGVLKIRILAEQDVQILQLSAAIPVVPEADLADRIDVAEVDLRIGWGVHILRFIAADLCVVGVCFVAVSQQLGIALGQIDTAVLIDGRRATIRSIAQRGHRRCTAAGVLRAVDLDLKVVCALPAAVCGVSVVQEAQIARRNILAAQIDRVARGGRILELIIRASFLKTEEIVLVGVPDDRVAVKVSILACQHDQIFQRSAVIDEQHELGEVIFLAKIQLNPIGWIHRIRFIFSLRLVVANNKILVVVMACVTIDDQ